MTHLISGLALHFNFGFVSANGRVSSPTVTIYFDQAIGIQEFFDLVGGAENIDGSNLALKNPSLLKAVLGEDSLKYGIIGAEPDVQGDDQDNTVIGNEDDNNIDGGEGDDELDGGEGSDTLDGGEGADTINGGDSFYSYFNFADYSQSDAPVMVALNGPLDDEGFIIGHSGGHAEGDRLKNIINLGGSRFDDHLIGDENDNWFEGFYGADKIDGGEGVDWSDYSHSYAGVMVTLNGPIDDEGFVIGHTGGHAEGDRMKNIEGIKGSKFNDVLTGNDDRDWLSGGEGNDILYGLDGNDALLGEEGHDIIYGGAGNDALVGWSGNDELYGGDGDDTFNGWGGDDKLQGGAGTDLLFGWDGNDEFIVELTENHISLDIVQDFTANEDKLNLYISIHDNDGVEIGRDYIVDDGDEPSIDDIISKLSTVGVTYTEDKGNTIFVQNGITFLILEFYTGLTAQDFASGTDYI